MALCGIRAGVTARSNSWSANAFTSAGGDADRKSRRIPYCGKGASPERSSLVKPLVDPT